MLITTQKGSDSLLNNKRKARYVLPFNNSDKIACNNLRYRTIKPLILLRSPQVVFHTIEAFRVSLKLARLKHNYRISPETKLSWNSVVLSYISSVILLKQDFNVNGFRGINLILYNSYFMNILWTSYLWILFHWIVSNNARKPPDVIVLTWNTALGLLVKIQKHSLNCLLWKH